MFLLLPSSICLEKYSGKNISTAAKFDLLGKIFCQKYFDCCQGPRPSATVSGDFLSVQLHGCSAHWRPARLPLLRRAGNYQPITFEDSFVSTNQGSCLSLAKKQLTRPRKKIFRTWSLGILWSRKNYCQVTCGKKILQQFEDCLLFLFNLRRRL